MTLEAECRRFGDLVVAGGTMSFQNDSLWCHQWQRGCRVDDLLFVFGVIHVNCEIISNCEAFKLLNEIKSITSMEFSESV